MPDYKFWMSHPSYKDKFSEAYKDAQKTGSAPEKKDRMKSQCDFALKMYDLEPEEVKQAISLENAENHSARFAAFKKLLSGKFTLEGVGELNDEDKRL